MRDARRNGLEMSLTTWPSVFDHYANGEAGGLSMGDIADQPALALKAGTPGLRLVPFLWALRPHHWARNTLVFLPISMAHQIFDAQLVRYSLLALCPSACSHPRPA
jgi:hypothetical protein